MDDRHMDFHDCRHNTKLDSINLKLLCVAQQLIGLGNIELRKVFTTIALYKCSFINKRTSSINIQVDVECFYHGTYLCHRPVRS